MAASEHINQVAKSTYEQLKAKYPNTRLGLSAYPDRLHLDVLAVPKGEQRKGVGSSIMSELTNVADQEKLTMSVTPTTALGGSRDGLDRFYRKFGFNASEESYQDLDSRKSLIRKPAK